MADEADLQHRIAGVHKTLMILRDHFALPVNSSNEVSLPVAHEASTSPELRGRCGVNQRDY